MCAMNRLCRCPACNRGSLVGALPGALFCARPRACSFKCAASLLRTHDQHAGLRQPCGYFSESKSFIVHKAHRVSAGCPSCCNDAHSQCTSIALSRPLVGVLPFVALPLISSFCSPPCGKPSIGHSAVPGALRVIASLRARAFSGAPTHSL